jgi:hypothetical protein
MFLTGCIGQGRIERWAYRWLDRRQTEGRFRQSVPKSNEHLHDRYAVKGESSDDKNHQVYHSKSFIQKDAIKKHN